MRPEEARPMEKALRVLARLYPMTRHNRAGTVKRSNNTRGLCILSVTAARVRFATSSVQFFSHS